jgi:IS5 family transposase
MQETMFTDALCEAMTSKRSFLKTIDSLIPWEDWISKIQPVYYEGTTFQEIQAQKAGK